MADYYLLAVKEELNKHHDDFSEQFRKNRDTFRKASEDIDSYMETIAETNRLLDDLFESLDSLLDGLR